MTTKPLEGRRALVTGGTRGIGHAVAARLIDDGAKVVVTGTSAAGQGPEGSDYHAVDFSNRDQTLSFVQDVAEMGLDILVNNAGINVIAPIEDCTLEDFERMQQVNVTAPFLLCRAAIPSMRAKGWGRIVNISSIWGKISKEFRAPYSATKFAIDGMTVAMAAEISEHGILANCVAPGFIDTELTRTNLGAAGYAELSQRVPARRFGSVDEIAAFVAWLAGPENTYISGQNIAIDGGFTRV